MTARFIVGDALSELRKLPDASVDLVFTSPPFLALRSYLPADHPDKAKELGSEATPGKYLDVLLDVVVECRRVLAPHGSLVFELGDTYAGSGAAGGDYGSGGLRDGQPGFEGSATRGRARGKSGSGEAYQYEIGNPAVAPHKPNPPRYRDDYIPSDKPGRNSLAYVNAPEGPPQAGKGGRGWPLDKSLSLVPQSFAWALAYGRNPWTGRELEPWRVRNIVRWCRPNPPVGQLGDKFRPATSELVVACTSRDRYFDLDAVREAYDGAPPVGGSASRQPIAGSGEEQTTERQGLQRAAKAPQSNPAGAPPLDFWVIPTAPYKGAHYATFPPALVVRPVKAMCPERVCRVCGKPSERIVEYSYSTAHGSRPNQPNDQPLNYQVGRTSKGGGRPGHVSKVPNTLGWSDCGCVRPEWPADGHSWLRWRPGVVLDPFAGSGTTLAVATGHGRDAIGIDLDVRNADLARERCGMFLEVVEREEVA